MRLRPGGPGDESWVVWWWVGVTYSQGVINVDTICAMKSQLEIYLLHVLVPEKKGVFWTLVLYAAVRCQLLSSTMAAPPFPNSAFVLSALVSVVRKTRIWGVFLGVFFFCFFLEIFLA